ncbi:hypothetical protein IV38_GL000655 [Lactobacillus selangorensis]|uniref:Cadmium resistance protein n=1 Tax=Lactobacillus selangorensis TaxID=81857 RepID=A0A0R2FZ00_9LACO|nr:cadmium resistance transporter [Lactobacillus selangorensis]KRN29766.1 hypothetical protein IV38_GL000655 [Lactobacillus selangorensis]KRN33705.1 hypothetical protein IV40_GL000013 [Lactobacillus selangorensis]
MLANLLPATFAFLATDMDDLFLLVTFLMVAVNEPAAKSRGDIWKVFIGQVIAFAMIVFASDLGSFGIKLLPQQFIAGLGAVPFFLGCQVFWSEHHEKREHQKKQINQHVVSVGFVMLTILADGGDNLGVYIPYFASLDTKMLLWTNLYLMVLICLWCALGLRLTRFKDFETFFHKHGENLTGTILIVLGLMLIFKGLR